MHNVPDLGPAGKIFSLQENVRMRENEFWGVLKEGHIQ